MSPTLTLRNAGGLVSTSRNRMTTINQPATRGPLLNKFIIQRFQVGQVLPMDECPRTSLPPHDFSSNPPQHRKLHSRAHCGTSKYTVLSLLIQSSKLAMSMSIAPWTRPEALKEYCNPGFLYHYVLLRKS